MKPARIFVLVGGLFFLAFSCLAYAGVPQMINYQGKLTTPAGALIDDTLSMVFTIYGAATGGTALWTETQASVIVEKGIFTVLLGSVNPIPDAVLTGAVRYLGVKVGADPEMTPRKEIVSVAYARTDGDWTFFGNNLYKQGGTVSINYSHTQDDRPNVHVKNFNGQTAVLPAYGTWGVYSGVSSDGSDFKIGVHGAASGYGGDKYGVYGYTFGTGTCWAGYFYGNAKVTGTLTKGGGSFQIDHPLDPENKYLFHSFVESPDMMNVYNGNVILDARGETTIELPDYFEALNMDFRYQLTCIGAFAPVYIAQKISGNQFTIAGGEPGMEVSWQVTGIRKDPFAEANRIQVEVDKPDNERGKYLHPKAYRLGEEYDIHYGLHMRINEHREQGKLQEGK